MTQHSYCLSLLADHAKPGASVLDVGSGSGYLTAVFGLMVRLFDPSKVFSCVGPRSNRLSNCFSWICGINVYSELLLF